MHSQASKAFSQQYEFQIVAHHSSRQLHILCQLNVTNDVATNAHPGCLSTATLRRTIHSRLSIHHKLESKLIYKHIRILKFLQVFVRETNICAPLSLLCAYMSTKRLRLNSLSIHPANNTIIIHIYNRPQMRSRNANIIIPYCTRPYACHFLHLDSRFKYLVTHVSFD